MIHFYFDFLSPYSYLAYMRVLKLRKEPGNLLGPQEFILRPVFLPQIIMSYQNIGPGDIPVKRDYMLKDCKKKAALEGLPFTVPKVLPFNSSIPLRLMTLFQGEEQWQLGGDLFTLAWGHGEDIGDENVLNQVLQKKGITLENLKDDMKHARIILKENHKLALEREIFGLPTFDYWKGEQKEFYWGNDSLQLLQSEVSQ